MWCHPFQEFQSVGQRSASVMAEEVTWLSHNIRILLILMRTQHYQKPWTRAEFYFPLTHQGTPSPLVIERVWNRTAPHRFMYLNTRSLVGTVGNWGWGRWGLAGRDGLPHVWVSEDTAQGWFPWLSLVQAQKPPEASPHASVASKRDRLYYLEGRARINPSLSNTLSLRSFYHSHGK